MDIHPQKQHQSKALAGGKTITTANQRQILQEKRSPKKAKVYVFSLIKKGVTSQTWQTAITKENYIQRKRKNNNK